MPAAWGGGACDLSEACRAALARSRRSVRQGEARAFFEHHFEPYSVVEQDGGGLLTGYFEPVLHGALTRTERFQVPVYRRPPDLVTVVPEDLRGQPGVGFTHMRKCADGTLEAYHTRAEIESGALAGSGLELCWLEDPVDAFFLQVQGSGLVLLADGGRVRLTYDGKNGHPYTSVGRRLIDQGEIEARAMSLDRLGAYLRADGTRGRVAMQANASFVFFRAMAENGDEGARGVLDTPLTPGRSLAVDASVHPLGAPVFVDAPTLRNVRSGRPFRRLMIAQDVGSAIRGRQRGDIFVGSGGRAGRIAGAIKHACRFFVLLPRSRGQTAGNGLVTT
jgi:membrane-bound lytic murein transglycosylase A